MPPGPASSEAERVVPADTGTHQAHVYTTGTRIYAARGTDHRQTRRALTLTLTAPPASACPLLRLSKVVVREWGYICTCTHRDLHTHPALPVYPLTGSTGMIFASNDTYSNCSCCTTDPHTPWTHGVKSPLLGSC